MYIRIFILGVLVLFSCQVQAIVLALPLDDEAPQKEREALEKSSFEKAQKYSGVCAVVIDDPSDDMLTQSTGTYFTKVGNKGFVLTSAHVAANGKAKQRFLYLSFGSGYRDLHHRIVVKKVYIHPNFHEAEEDAAGTIDKYSRVNDIGILEFDASKLSANITPLMLDDTKDYAASKYEGIILGYGPFGFNTSTLLSSDTLHNAMTYAYFDEGGEQPIFQITLPHLSNLYPRMKDLYRFATTLPPSSSIFSTEADYYPTASSFTMGLIINEVHSQQGFLTPGDEGGPLLFRDKSAPARFKLVGVASSSGMGGFNNVYVKDDKTGNRPLKTANMTWQPVFPHRHWINMVIEGKTKKRNTEL